MLRRSCDARNFHRILVAELDHLVRLTSSKLLAQPTGGGGHPPGPFGPARARPASTFGAVSQPSTFGLSGLFGRRCLVALVALSAFGAFGLCRLCRQSISTPDRLAKGGLLSPTTLKPTRAAYPVLRIASARFDRVDGGFIGADAGPLGSALASGGALPWDDAHQARFETAQTRSPRAEALVAPKMTRRYRLSRSCSHHSTSGASEMIPVVLAAQFARHRGEDAGADRLIGD